MNKKKITAKTIQELKYDLEREPDSYKSHQLILNYLHFDKKLADLQNFCDIQCSDGNWNYDPYMHGMANGLIFAESIMTNTEPKFLDAPKEWLFDKNECTCVYSEQGLHSSDNCDIHGSSNESYWNQPDNGKQPVLDEKTFCEKIDTPLEECSCESDDDNWCMVHGPFDDNPIVNARKVLRDAFAKDSGFKLSYMANMRMFINDRIDVLIDEQVIYDMIDYIFQE